MLARRIHSFALMKAAAAASVCLTANMAAWGQATPRSAEPPNAQSPQTPPAPRPERPIIFGLQWATTADGRPVIASVAADSPAAAAGLMPGDQIVAIRQKEVATSREVTEELAGRAKGERIEVRIVRQGRPQTLELIADGTLPVLADGPDAVGLDERVFGWRIRAGQHGPMIAETADGGAASTAGLRAGDVILAVDRTEVRSPREFSELLRRAMSARQGEPVSLTVMRGEQQMAVRLPMPANKGPSPAPRTPGPVVPADRDDSGRVFGMVVRNTGGGLIVVEVADGSPAAVAGLAPGDTILALGNNEINTYRGLLRALDLVKPASEMNVVFAREGEEHEAKLVIGRKRPADKGADQAALQEQASHILVGGVKAIYSFEQTTPDWQVTHRVAEIAVANVEKGEGVAPGQLVYVRYAVNKPATLGEEAAETPYPNVRSTFRLFVQRAADGGYDLLMPGGAQVIDTAKSAADPPRQPVNPPGIASTTRPAEPPAPVSTRVTPPATPPLATPVERTPPSTVAPVAAGPGIDGAVFLGDAPQPGMQVDLWDAAGLVKTTTTAEDGTFAIAAPPGRYQLSARGRVGNLIRVAPPITVFVPIDAPQRTAVRVPLP